MMTASDVLEVLARPEAAGLTAWAARSTCTR